MMRPKQHEVSATNSGNTTSHYEAINFEIDQSSKDRESIKSALLKFSTFYEDFFKFLHVSPMLGCIILGVLIMLVHGGLARSRGISIWDDRSIFLGPLIGLYLFFIVSATNYLREFLLNLALLAKKNIDELRTNYLDRLKVKVGNRNLALCGIASGLLYSSVGVAYGHWYRDGILSCSLMVQHFIFAAIGGIGAWGLFLIIVFIRDLAADMRPRFDFFSPDNCAGTGIIGKLLFRFAMYGMIMGFLIPAYIYFSPFTQQKSSFALDALVYLLMSLPLLASLIVFIYPVLHLHLYLLEYKINEHKKIRAKLKDITEKLYAIDLDNPGARQIIEIITSYYDHLVEVEKVLLKMNTWPYDMKQRFTYFASLISPIPISALFNTLKHFISN